MVPLNRHHVSVSGYRKTVHASGLQAPMRHGSLRDQEASVELVPVGNSGAEGEVGGESASDSELQF